MTEHEPITREESMALSLPDYINRCKAWMDEFNDGQLMKVSDLSKCPVQIWVVHNHQACGRDIVAGIINCEICGQPICPDCSNHGVTQLSRVTGYIQDVAGFNAGKRQELVDRKKHDTFG